MEKYASIEEQKARVRKGYLKKTQCLRSSELPIWNGKRGPVYARVQYDGPTSEQINETRHLPLKDQLAVYNQEQISRSIWFYKNIGFQGTCSAFITNFHRAHIYSLGMVSVGLETPYMKKFLLKKYKLAAGLGSR